jgi:hypothetical protein
MKKIFFIVVFVLHIATMVFSDGIIPWLQTLFSDYIYTSEGYFFGSMDYYGKNIGQRLANQYNSWNHLTQTTRISNGRWEAVNKMINRYQHSAGDTYVFHLGFIPRGKDTSVDSFFIVVEYTSNTQYRWWAFFDITSEVYR